MASTLTDSVAALRNESAILRAHRRHRSNLRLPAVALPPELLGEIFLYACLDSPVPLSTGTTSPEFRKVDTRSRQRALSGAR